MHALQVLRMFVLAPSSLFDAELHALLYSGCARSPPAERTVEGSAVYGTAQCMCSRCCPKGANPFLCLYPHEYMHSPEILATGGEHGEVEQLLLLLKGLGLCAEFLVLLQRLAQYNALIRLL
jgi:hypothetical protein